MFEWKITLRHDRQGFQKRYVVSATNYIDAVNEANNLLRVSGYRPPAFDVVSLTRGREL
jgi:hypothetical protein